MGRVSLQVFMEVFRIEPSFCLNLFRLSLQKYESLDQMRSFIEYMKVLLQLISLSEQTACP